MRINIRERGDTIVEVLMAIAIVSAVIAGAYVATNRSLKTAQAARERSEAIKVAEAQIERLKYLTVNPNPHGPRPAACVSVGTVWVDYNNDGDVDAADECPPAPDIFDDTTTFCIPSTYTTPEFQDTNPDPAFVTAVEQPLGCLFSPRYLVQINYDAATQLHEVSVIWENASGEGDTDGLQGYDGIKMYYRVYADD